MDADRSSPLLWTCLGVLAAVVVLFSLGLERLLRNEPGDHPIGRFTAYLAPRDTCPGGDDPTAPPAAQERTMLCLVNYARGREGVTTLAASPLLMRSAALKAADIGRCTDFSHTACGKPGLADFEAVGYTEGASDWSFGENIAWGSDGAASPRSILNGWLNSREHRANLFRPDWTEQGVAVVRLASFRGSPRASIWASHFARRS